MATPRRIQLTTLSHADPDFPPRPGLLPPPGPPCPAEKTLSARIELVLFEPDDARCAEFHYPQLIAVRGEGRDGSLIQVQEEHDGDEGGEELEELATRFQQKYGGACKQRKERVQDLVDMGYGYDDDDSFIDNSEAYDELVPACLTTKYGGFYINVGTLHFRPASGEENESDDFEENVQPKKRKLTEGGGEMKMKKKRKEDAPAEGGNAEHSGPSGKKKTRASKQQHKPNLSGMLKKFHKEKLQELHLFNMKMKESPPAANHDSNQQDASVTADLLVVLGDADSTDLHKAVMEEDEFLSDDPLQESRETPPEASQASLPDGLPPALEHSLQELTQAICNLEEGKKMEMFAQEINTILLDVSVQRKELPGEVFSRIFSYMSSLLSSTKHTLLRRATKLHLLHLDDQLLVLIRSLQGALCRVMPEQIHRFNHHCQAHCEAKAARLEAVKEKRAVEGSEEEEDDLSGKRVFGPRKRFRWNEEIRELLCEMVRVKMRSFELEAAADQSLEDYLKCFLEARVKTLWPRGWMQSRILLIESRRVHAHVTGVVVRKKSMAAPKSDKGHHGDGIHPETKCEENIDVWTSNKVESGAKSQKIPAQKIRGDVSAPLQLSAEEMKPVERDVYCPPSLLCSTSMSLAVAAMEGSCGDPALPTPSLSHQTSSSRMTPESEVMKGFPFPSLPPDNEPVGLTEICRTSRLPSAAPGSLQCSLMEGK